MQINGHCTRSTLINILINNGATSGLIHDNQYAQCPRRILTICAMHRCMAKIEIECICHLWWCTNSEQYLHVNERRIEFAKINFEMNAFIDCVNACDRWISESANCTTARSIGPHKQPVGHMPFTEFVVLFTHRTRPYIFYDANDDRTSIRFRQF